MVRAERLLLRSFGFIVHVEQPHRFVLNYTAVSSRSWAVSSCATAIPWDCLH